MARFIQSLFTWGQTNETPIQPQTQTQTNNTDTNSNPTNTNSNTNTNTNDNINAPQTATTTTTTTTTNNSNNNNGNNSTPISNLNIFTTNSKVVKIGSFIGGLANTVFTKIGEEGKKIIDEGNIDDDGTLQIDLSSLSPPWKNYPSGTPLPVQETVTMHIMGLTRSKRNFLNAPPDDVNFPFDFKESLPLALVSLKADPYLEGARFYLVPKYITEEKFWKNWFYRVNVIKEAYGVRGDTYIASSNPEIPTTETKKQVEEKTEKLPEENSPNWNSLNMPSEAWEAEIEAELRGLDPRIVDMALSLEGKVTDEWEKQLKTELGLNENENENENHNENTSENQNATQSIEGENSESVDDLEAQIRKELSGDE